MSELLLRAAGAGDLSRVQELLAAGADTAMRATLMARPSSCTRPMRAVLTSCAR